MSDTAPITVGNVAFERKPNGCEVARRDGRIVGVITPDGFGRGGWAWVGDGADWPAKPHWVAKRADGRLLIAELCGATP